MSVFLAASDESASADKNGLFLHGGFVASEADWNTYFIPAWKERVLDGRPRIPYLHMTDIRSQRWRADHGISYPEAERRTDEATRVIASMGSLFLVTSGIDEGHFRRHFNDTGVVRPTVQAGVFQFEPDYLGFLAFAFRVLHYVHETAPNAEKVNFAVERKQGIRLGDFHDTMSTHLQTLGLPHLAALVGELIPGSKDVVPLQAADLALWHIRRRAAGTADPVDVMRYRRIGSRLGTAHAWTRSEIDGFAARSLANAAPSPFKKRPRQPGAQ